MTASTLTDGVSAISVISFNCCLLIFDILYISIAVHMSCSRSRSSRSLTERSCTPSTIAFSPASPENSYIYIQVEKFWSKIPWSKVVDKEFGRN